jgi:predicted nuclease of predicted toxin-antitoxin system
MKLLLDEHLSPIIAEGLRAKKHDVICVLETDLERQPDQTVWERAIAEERVVVTYDKGDFLLLFTELFQEGTHHHGLVVIASRTIPSHDFGGLIRALEHLLERDPDLRDQILFLHEPERP